MTAGSKLPSTFGKYSILGHLATGGMAEVYLARQAGLHGFEKIVVIKRVRPELTQDPEATQHFLDEARLVATLEHPNIAQVYEIGLVNDSYFFVMEYVHGADLRQLMESAVTKRIKISLADSVYIMIGVCSALHYAHEKRDRDGRPLSIIHRDVSPSNVLISHDGAVKVCDFGIAKADNRTSVETTRGVLKGKFAYMSPEQCRSMPLDRRSDVFSIGILLYELSTLSRLFIANSDFDLLRSVIEEEAPPPSTRTRNYSPELEHIVLKALAKNPDERYPTAQAMQLELEAFAREHKLAMSSVNIAALMGQLFEKRIDAWLRARSEGQELGDYLLDTAVEKEEEDELPTFLPVGTAETTDPLEKSDTAVHQRSQPIKMVEAPPRAKRATRPPTPAPISDDEPHRGHNPVWLALAVLAGAVAILLPLVAPTAHVADRVRFEADARRIATTLDDVARSTQQRADNVASAPIVTAAIETDADTMRDLAKTEHLFEPKPGEVATLFQRRDGKTTRLIQLPANAPTVEAMAGRGNRLASDGKVLTVIVSSPIKGPHTEGTFQIVAPVDLAFAKAALTDQVATASLTGFGPELVLVNSQAPAGSEIDIDLPDTHSHLVIAPLAATSVGWLGPARIAAGVIAVLLFALWLAGFRRGRDATVPVR